MADDVDERGLPRVLAVAWGVEVAPQRGPKRELSHERIIEAAIELADADGLPAVTMQRLAQALGYTTMALYRYVGSKDELHALMSDAAIGDIDGIAVDETDWRAGVLGWAEALSDHYRTHPWLLDLPPTPVSLLMPGNMRVVDRVLRVLGGRGLDLGVQLDVVSGLSLLVRGFEGIARDFRRAPVRLDASARAELTQVVTPERFPALGPLVASGVYFGASDDDADDAGSRDSTPSSDPVWAEAAGDRWGSSASLIALLDGIERMAPIEDVPSDSLDRTPEAALVAAERELVEAVALRDAIRRRAKEADRAVERARAARTAARADVKAAARA